MHIPIIIRSLITRISWMRNHRLKQRIVKKSRTNPIHNINLGAVSIKKMSSYQYRNPHVKIRQSRDRLIFNMGIPYLGKTVFILRQGPALFSIHDCVMSWKDFPHNWPLLMRIHLSTCSLLTSRVQVYMSFLYSRENCLSDWLHTW